MKEKLIFRTAIVQIGVSLIAIIAGILFLSSCNGKAEKKESPDTTQVQQQTQSQSQSQTQDQPDSTTVAFTNMDFPILYAEFSSIVTLFRDPDVGLRRKLVLRFDFDGSNTQPTLSGFTARAGGEYVSNTVPLITLLKSTSTPVSIATPFYLGNIELSRTEFRELRDAPQRRRYLLFIPVKSTATGLTNVVTYYTDWSETVPTNMTKIRPYATGDELNPSPPRNPS